MKKIVALLTVFIINLSCMSVCYAGDVPEALLYTDSAQLYFGKVMEVTDASITIFPVKKVKGDVEPDTAITYSQEIHGSKPQAGKTYLFGYIDENNLYFWITDTMEPKTLKLKNANGMSLRLQEYLNNGDFEEAEEARQNKTAVTASPWICPTITQAQSPANTASQPPVNTDLSLPINAGALERPAPSLLPIIIASLVGALLIITGLIFLVIWSKRNNSNK